MPAWTVVRCVLLNVTVSSGVSRLTFRTAASGGAGQLSFDVVVMVLSRLAYVGPLFYLVSPSDGSDHGQPGQV